MSIIYKSDLKNVNSETISYLESEISSCTSIINKIRGIIFSSSFNISGESKKALINRLSFYEDAYKTKKKLARLLLDNIKYSNGSMKSYMGFYDVLDDSKLSELKSTLYNIENSLSSLEEKTSQDLVNLFKVISLKFEINHLSELQDKDNLSSSYLNDISNDINNYQSIISDMEIISLPSGYINE